MAVGADAYCRDAGVAAETARRLIDERRARVAWPTATRQTRRAARPRRRLRRARPRARRADPRSPNVDITCLPATLHNRPGGIPAAVRERIRRRRAGYDRVFVAYADCGTGGMLDKVIAEEGVERLAGAHCYQFYAGHADFDALVADEPADVLPHRFPRPQLRPARDPGPRASIATPSCSRPISATTAGSSISPRPTIRPLVAAARRGARRLGLALRGRADRPRRARHHHRRPSPRAPRPGRHLAARHRRH